MNDAEALGFLALLQAYNLTQHIDSPTHIKGRTLDVVVIRKDSHILHSTPQVYPSGIGDGRGKSLLDHYAIQFDIQIPTNHKPPHVISYRKTKDISITDFRHDIENLVLSDTDPCDLVSSYNSKLCAQLDIHAPVVTKTIPNCRQARLYTPQLREKKQECRKAERRMCKTKPPLAVHIESFDQQSKEANELLEITKEQFYTDKVSSVDGAHLGLV